MYSYVTYWQLADYLYGNRVDVTDLTSENNAPTSRNDQLKIMDFARRITQRIENDTISRFVPFHETRYFDARYSTQIDYAQNILSLHYPISSLISVTLGDGTSLTVDIDVRIRPRDQTPGYYLQLLGSRYSWTQYSTDWHEAIAVNGIWGARVNYSTDAWIDTIDTIQDIGGITATDTTITVTAADGVDANHRSPRFDLGQVLRIENEYLIVIDVNYTDKKLTVLRGQLGTTAAIHANGTAIDRFDIQPEIVMATAMTVSNHNALIGRQGGIVIGQDTSINMPSDYPDAARAILEDWKTPIIRVV